MWALAKRTFLFFAVNALILLTVSVAAQIVLALLGGRLTIAPEFVVFYAIIGFGGALVSLALSRQMAKWTMGVQLIDPNTPHAGERQLLETVYNLARAAQLPKMPEVGIYDSPEVNAFATGPTKSRSLVAVSSGLLRSMDRDAVEGVLGHEITHIANGDMVTMTLLQGMINTMVLIVARVVASVLSGSVEERSRPMVQMLAFYLLQFVFSLLGSLVVNWFSRYREFRADYGGARLAGRDRMIAGLRSLQRITQNVAPEPGEDKAALATLKISAQPTGSWAALFATHPPLEVRIRRLETMAI